MSINYKNQNEKKLQGKVYTPDNIVKKILDEVGYKNKEILGKKILDPSCGDGQFLKETVRRILEYSPKDDIKKNLENVYGWDIDEEAIEKCKIDLDSLVKQSIQIKINWNIGRLTWNIYEEDALKKIENKHNEKFDFIVGNPPYIRVHHLPKEDRLYIKSKYAFSKKGVIDIYIAFFELCDHYLKENGICGLITPNSYFSTENARYLRDYFIENQNIKKIINFRDQLLFPDAQTYSAITIFDKKKKQSFHYIEQVPLDNENPPDRIISFSEFKENSAWQLSINKPEKLKKGKTLKEICDIHVGLATLMDRAYIFRKDQSTKTYYNTHKGEVDLEPEILKKIIKASRYSKNRKIEEYILFPYEKINGKHQIISDKDLQNKFPKAYQYLISIQEQLAQRDKGSLKAPEWYAFGRSQGLDTSFGDKIVFSYMNNEPKFNFVQDKNNEITFYSGYCIKLKDKTLNYHKLLEQLNSERMKEFIHVSSRYFQGGWQAYNKKIIENFIIDLEKF
ncbi:MAG: N-6 DNA methylase [Microscillaceae bacterium]|nr:N-6 DNA methylase [Microscillaceae bacterium]